jgi:hypothetical protein
MYSPMNLMMSSITAVFFLFSNFFGISVAPETATKTTISSFEDKSKFLIEAGRSVTVKENCNIGPNTVLEVRGVLLIEGDLVIRKDLELIVAGEGKLYIKGDVIAQSTAIKNIQVLDRGELSVEGTFNANENTKIMTQGGGSITTNRVVASKTVQITGTRQFVASACACDSGLNCDFCQMFPVSRRSK